MIHDKSMVFFLYLSQFMFLKLPEQKYTKRNKK